MENDTDFNKFRKSGGSQSINDSFLSRYQDPSYLGFKLFFWNIGKNLGSETIQNIEPTVNIPTDSSQNRLDRFITGAKDKYNRLKGTGGNLTDSSTFSERVKENSENKWQSPKNTYNNSNLYSTINSDGLFGSEQNPNSALYYLKQIGDRARYEMLLDFIRLLSEINSKYDHYFTSISGLSEAWKREFTKPKFVKEITIDCLESLDLRITGLMDLYRKIVYDWENRRYVLPDNLRTFSMTVKVFDTRKWSGVPGGSANLKNEVIARNEKFFGEDPLMTGTQLNFDLHWCQFMPDDSGSFLENISNETKEATKQKIKITYEKIEENAIYRVLSELSTNERFYFVKDYLNSELEVFGFSGSTIEPSSNTIENKRESRFSKTMGAALDRVTNFARDRISAEVENAIRSQANTLFLGNVYGFSTSTVTNNPEGGLRNIARGDNNNTQNTETGAHNKNKDLGNIYE